MQTNAVPHYDNSVHTTECCPMFNSEGWDGQDLHFQDRAFMRETTRSAKAKHVPVDMAEVFERVKTHIVESDACDPDNFTILSRDPSAPRSEHLFSISGPVAEETTGTPGDVYFFYATCARCEAVYGKNHVVGIASSNGAVRLATADGLDAHAWSAFGESQAVESALSS